MDEIGVVYELKSQRKRDASLDVPPVPQEYTVVLPCNLYANGRFDDRIGFVEEHVVSVNDTSYQKQPSIELSLWSSNVGVPKSKYLSEGSMLPFGFKLVFDRTYLIESNGQQAELNHYLLVNTVDCDIDSFIGQINDSPAFDWKLCDENATNFVEPHHTGSRVELDADNTIDELFAVQTVFKLCSKDESQSLSRRNDAKILAAWLGNVDMSFATFVCCFRWACKFAEECLARYTPEQNKELGSYFAEHHYNAVTNTHILSTAMETSASAAVSAAV